MCGYAQLFDGVREFRHSRLLSVELALVNHYLSARDKLGSCGQGTDWNPKLRRNHRGGVGIGYLGLEHCVESLSTLWGRGARGMDLKQVGIGLPNTPDFVADILNYGPERLCRLDVMGKSVAHITVNSRCFHAVSVSVEEKLGLLGTRTASNTIDKRQNGANRATGGGIC